LNVGQEARDFTINPFSLPYGKENLQFLFTLRCLSRARNSVTGSTSRKNASCGRDRADVHAGAGQRTVSNFGNIIGELKERLHRWAARGSTAFSSTTPRTHFVSALQHSTSRLGRCAGGVGTTALLCPASRLDEIADRRARHFRFPVGRGLALHQERDHQELFVQAQKTWRKHNAG